MAAIRDIFLTSVLVLFVIGSAGGVLIGVGLIVRAPAMLRLFQTVNRWSLTWLDIKAREEKPVSSTSVLGESQRRLVGGLFMAGGAFAAIVLAMTGKIPELVVAKVWGAASIVSLVIVEAIRWILVVGCLFAVYAGVLLVFFPVAWKRFEEKANRWKSTRGFFARADEMRTPLDRWVESSPQTAGILIAILSTVALAAFAVLLHIRKP